MNKQLTKKTIGIAASAALIASVAISGNALAAKGGNSQSPTKGSIGVTNTCEVKVNPYDKNDVVLELTSVIVDKSSGDGAALEVEWSAQAQEKYQGRDLFPIGDVKDAYYAGIPEDANGEKKVTVTKTFDLCDAGIYEPNDPGMSTYAKAANAQTIVMIKDGHMEEGWISRCVDLDSTEVNELETLKLEQGLCPGNTDRQDQE